MRIGLYFGSFNPIHNGHIGLANYLLNSDLEEVWLIVSPQNPLKKSSELLNDHLRLEMARLAVVNTPKIKVCDVEFALPKPSYTIDTLTHLSKKYSDVEFVVLIGADNVSIFHHWKSYQEILEKHKVWVYPRKGFPNHSEEFPTMHFIDAPLFDLSSTEIRDRIKKYKPCHQLLPLAVEEFIKKQNLYH